jgi:transporter family protein
MSIPVSIVFAISAMFSFGVADFMAKVIVNRVSAYRTALISQSVGSILYLALALAYDLSVPDAPTLLLVILSGILSAGVLFSFYKALSLGKASLVSPVSSCLTVVAIVLSFLILGETLTTQQTLVVAAVFVGMLLVAFEKSSTKLTSNTSMLFALAVVFLGGANAIIQKLIATSSHYLISFSLSRLIMVGCLLSLMPLLGKETAPTFRATRTLIIMGVLGLLDVTGFFAWFIGLRQGLVSIVTPIVNSSPALTVILAHVFLRERVFLHQKIGMIIIIIGIVLLSAIS